MHPWLIPLIYEYTPRKVLKTFQTVSIWYLDPAVGRLPIRHPEPRAEEPLEIAKPERPPEVHLAPCFHWHFALPCPEIRYAWGWLETDIAPFVSRLTYVLS